MAQARVLIIYTGGTIGMFPRERANPLSPLAPGALPQLLEYVPIIERMPVALDFHSFEPLVDSSDMHPERWVELARLISKWYERYDGFVVLHGTDTMAYTASALSFLLENLSKPVVLTGSQIPIGRSRSDAIENLITSIQIASGDAYDLPCAPEVMIYFRNKLLRGNRATKVSAVDLASFDSPNLPPLATVGPSIEFAHRLLRPVPTAPLAVHERIDTRVWSLDVFPGMRPADLDRLLALPGLKGVVLNTFGAGNVPSDAELISVLRRASERGITIVNVSQCLRATVEMGMYETGAQLLAAGVVSGVDMTRESALTKLMFLIGEGLGPDQVRSLMEIDLRGEQSYSLLRLAAGPGECASGTAMVSLPPSAAAWTRERVRRAVLRFDGLRRTDGKPVASVRVFMGHPGASSETPDDDPHCVPFADVRFAPGTSTSGVTIASDSSRAARRVLQDGRSPRLTVVAPDSPIAWDELSLSLVVQT